MSELYLFEEGSTKYGFTASLFGETYLGTEYVSTIITRNNITQTDNFAKSPVSIRFERTHTYARRLLNTIIERAVLVTVYKDHSPYWQGRVIKPKASGPYIDIYCESLFAASAKAGMHVTVSSQCWKTLYTPQCGVLKSSFASVYSPSFIDTLTIDIPAMTEESGYFNAGIASMNGEERHISSHSGTQITIYSEFTDVSGNITLYPGCDLSENNCEFKFNNLVNHIGFSRLPHKNPFKSTGLL